jgi:hypothetical protein
MLSALALKKACPLASEGERRLSEKAMRKI